MIENILTPDGALKKIKDKIGPRYKLGIVLTIVIFCITHGYFFLNRYANEDYHHSVYVNNNGIEYGRWMSGFSVHYISPWVIGLIALIGIVISVTTIISIFEIKSSISIGLISLLMVSFPTLAYTFGYMIPAATYTISIMMSIIAVWVTRRYKFGYLLGGVCLAFSLGYYQSYIAITMTICVIDIILSVLESNISKEKLFKVLVNYFLMGIIGLILYFIILKSCIFLTGIQLDSYKGINQIGKIPFENIGQLLERTYKKFIAFFLGNKFFYNNIFTMIMYSCSFIVTAYLMYKQSKRISKLNKLVVVCLILIIPFCVNIIDFIVPASESNTLNIYACVMISLIPIKLIEGINLSKSKNLLFSSWMIVVALCTIGINYYYISNVYYLKLSTYYEQTQLFYNRLYSRIEEIDESRDNGKLAIMGNSGSIKSILGNQSNDFPIIMNDQGLRERYIGMSELDLLGTTYKGISFINNIIGKNYIMPTAEELEYIRSTEDYKKMDVYPARSSVKLIDDILVVKMEPSISVNAIEKNGELYLSVTDSEEYPDIQVAWYIYKDYEQIDTKWYDTDLSYSYTITGPGTYKATCFIIDKDGNPIYTADTESVIIQ